MNKISNTEFDSALNDDNNKKIINKAKKKYKKLIPPDELKSCTLNALWKSLAKFKTNRNTKFSSFLYSMVVWECKTWILNQNKHHMIYIDNAFDIIYDGHNQFYEMIECLPPNLAKVIEQRIIYNMTLKEIGKENNYSHESARELINKALAHLRDVYRTDTY